MFLSLHVDLQYDEISLTFTAGPVCLCGVSSPVVVLGLFVRLVCSSLLVSVCMFIVSKALLKLSATLIVRAGVHHLVEPLCYGVVYCV